MKARNFRYVRPRSLKDACRILADAGGEAVPIAGGQSLLVGLNMRLSAPKLLVDIADLQELRPHPGQAASAANLRRLLAGSAIVASHREGDSRVQDAYSLRCSPQVHGAARDTVAHCERVAAVELVSAIDNLVKGAAGQALQNFNVACGFDERTALL